MSETLESETFEEGPISADVLNPDDVLEDLDFSEVTDLDLTDSPKTPGSIPRLFSSLHSKDKPLIPLPFDAMGDVQYPIKFEPRCSLCKSHWRSRAEHIYVESGRRSQSVVNFFLRHFNAKASWEAIDTHMRNHCDLRRVSKSGINAVLNREDDYIKLIKYKELDFSITGIALSIDEIGGMDCSTRPELAIKVHTLLKGLYHDLVEFQKERDAQGSSTLNVFTILREIYDAMPSSESKEVVRVKVEQLRMRLADG